MWPECMLNLDDAIKIFLQRLYSLGKRGFRGAQPPVAGQFFAIIAFILVLYVISDLIRSKEAETPFISLVAPLSQMRLVKFLFYPINYTAKTILVIM